jgi:hypothetical protein
MSSQPSPLSLLATVLKPETTMEINQSPFFNLFGFK